MKIGELQIKMNNPVNTKQVEKTFLQGSKKLGQFRAERNLFSDVLKNKIKSSTDLKFSSHAMKRIEDRNIHLNSENISRLENGIKEAEKKGSVNSVIMMDNSAYIVSIKNKTVVTAVDQLNTRGNIFTNIDSVAIV